MEREKAIAQYILAFDRGDLDELAEILDRAAEDPELDRQIAGINGVLHAEAGLPNLEDQAQAVRGLLLRYFPDESSAPAVEPLTVSEVATRLQADYATSRAVSEHDRELNHQLLASLTLVPSPVNDASIARLVAQLDVSASEAYWEAFRRTAVLLSIVRQRGEIELAAARSQRHVRSSKRAREESRTTGPSGEKLENSGNHPGEEPTT
jgi:hypothetical protein